jgi:hypothetical protein
MTDQNNAAQAAQHDSRLSDVNWSQLNDQAFHVRISKIKGLDLGVEDFVELYFFPRFSIGQDDVLNEEMPSLSIKNANSGEQVSTALVVARTVIVHQGQSPVLVPGSYFNTTGIQND